jgi:hypothetical protein
VPYNLQKDWSLLQKILGVHTVRRRDERDCEIQGKGFESHRRVHLHLGRSMYFTWFCVFMYIRRSTLDSRKCVRASCFGKTNENMHISLLGFAHVYHWFFSKFLLLSLHELVTPHELHRMLALNRLLGKS